MSTLRLFRHLIAFVGMLASAPALAFADAAPQPAPPAFIIGVWYQPTGSFPGWKSRGINTLIGYESENHRTTVDDWTGTAVDNGLFMIRQPHPHIQDDVGEPYLLAWLHADEPDVRKPPADPEELAAIYAEWKKADPKKPIFLNVSGGNVLFHKVPEETYRAYFKSADWVGNDFYPVTGWADAKLMPKVGQIIDTLREWSGGKPQLAFIESSPQHLTWTPRDTPGVTPDQFRGEIWDAVIHGARGICYFPQQIGGGFKYDNTPPEVSAEMTVQNKLLTELSPVLASEPNPAGISAAAPPPIETTVRKGPDGNIYVFALNLSPDSQKAKTVKLTGVKIDATKPLHEPSSSLIASKNELTDDFAAFQLHIYVVEGK